MESEIENWTAKAESWRRHADLSRKRAAIVRKVAGMMRGTEPLPDGLTRAALVVCGTAWRGFEWTRRGVEVSRSVWGSEMAGAERTQAVLLRELAKQRERAARVVEGWEIAAAVSGAVLGNRPRLAEEETCDKVLAPVLAAVAGCLDALNEEGKAWRDFEAAYLEAREAVPVEEIESARARLEAEEASKVQPVRVEVAGLGAVVENTAAAALAAKQGAQEARRTWEAVEQQGAAVVGAVRDVGAVVGEVGKAKPPARSKDGTAKRKKRTAWPDKARDMARAFRRALPSLLPDDSPLNDKGGLDARGVVGGWSAITKCFERWATRNPGLVPVAFPRGAASVEDALKSLFRALKDSGE